MNEINQVTTARPPRYIKPFVIDESATPKKEKRIPSIMNQKGLN